MKKKLWAGLCVVLEDHKRAGPNFQFCFEPDSYSVTVPAQRGLKNSVRFQVTEEFIFVHCAGQTWSFPARDLPRLAARESLTHCQTALWNSGGQSEPPNLDPGQLALGQIETKTGVLLDREGNYWLGWGEPFLVFESSEEVKAFLLAEGPVLGREWKRF
ncbi:MAG: hypothetical protein P1V97_09285 [Planctomycetota bacterium]|nr:hypothetical protein [Planctomycetota bacterium]